MLFPCSAYFEMEGTSRAARLQWERAVYCHIFNTFLVLLSMGVMSFVKCLAKHTAFSFSFFLLFFFSFLKISDVFKEVHLNLVAMACG